MQTRQEYVALPYVDNETGTARHRAYYAQFASSGLIAAVVGRIGAERIETGICRDGCFNDIALAEWDVLRPLVMLHCGRALNAANGTGGVSLSDCVCVAKECAKQWREAYEQKGTKP